MFPERPRSVDVVDDLLEERDRLVEVPDLDRDVVDPDEPSHVARLAVSRGLTRGGP